MKLDPHKTSLRREGLSRREMSRRLFGVAVACPFCPMHPIWRHFSNATFLSHDTTDVASVNWKPKFLAPEQHEALQSLSEAIVPGSIEAHVSRFIDLLLGVDSAEHQKRFLASLSAIQTEVVKRYGKPFQRLSASQRNSLLSVISTSPENNAIRNSFDDLKEWITRAYYTSEAGMKELGWRPDRVFSSFPGCVHPDGHP